MVVTVERLNAWKRRHFDVAFFFGSVSWKNDVRIDFSCCTVRGRTENG